MAQPGAQTPRPQRKDTKVAKAKMDAMTEKIQKDFGFNAPKTKVAPTPKGSVARTFDTSKLMPKLTRQDKASLAIMQKLYGEKPYKAYTKKP
tara:strand:- start:2626 stop:2901 length:276 start_codon:yes stop_codon:yes gene_type:complete